MGIGSPVISNPELVLVSTSWSTVTYEISTTAEVRSMLQTE
jgi:hypothetical protein